MRVSCAQWAVPDDTELEIAYLRGSIVDISKSADLDPRFTLAIALQESKGCVRAPTTYYSHANPGIYQSFNGTGSCNDNSLAVGIVGCVLYPCPRSEIEQQVMDGVNGTQWGPGLRQNFEQQGHLDVSGYHRAARIYNGGGLLESGDLEGPCCTPSYVSDIANRLTGWAYAPWEFTG